VESGHQEIRVLIERMLDSWLARGALRGTALGGEVTGEKGFHRHVCVRLVLTARVSRGRVWYMLRPRAGIYYL